ncbi:replication-relaxation family protein [Streptomyces sp. NBC_01198]|uniref:replication-relaxation family protein n=1 Tax=Streptomyces sp. NBC_01198 TaxID=2903769 RepID=UPI002E109FEF|nr:replication-relaxation family protein [Streptomyces sp. NBC_01198]
MGGHARGAGTGGRTARHGRQRRGRGVHPRRQAPRLPGRDRRPRLLAHRGRDPLSSSGKRNVRVDAVFQDKDAGVPLLMVEVDRSTESAHVLADKAGAYADLYARRVRPRDFLPAPATARSAR